MRHGDVAGADGDVAEAEAHDGDALGDAEEELDRLAARGRDAGQGNTSTADIAVYERMRPQAEPIRRSHIRVEATGDIEAGIEAVLSEMDSLEERERSR